MQKEKEKRCNRERVEEETQRSRFISLADSHDIRKIKPAILLHSCCGPCSTAVVERLSGRYDITIFFYNPNITDQEEYEKRRAAQLDFIEKYNDRVDSRDRIAYFDGAYEPERFYSAVKGTEMEPEGGKRCNLCYELRLEKTAETASMSGFDTFGTTLSVSPYKNLELINKIGMKLSMRYSLTFLGEDFKKQGGYQRSIELSKQYNLYRQHYCGCIFSDKAF
ncbi:MAG: epoxyqueuosine reductase QueH [Eubacteriales bacterium]|nr:epoxyqueuosine reductase QueH [Eubacteriales bacterium]MDD3198890.1 epoxyqueuosine reductase QueH [Eubacteriales bacterium]MDD4630077.1 epoxyqueuosine reductase QueH [Eubacteriales bacterium]